MFDYSEIAETANEILAEYGQAVTLTRIVPGTYNPATGGMTGASTSTQTGWGAVFEYINKNIDGTLIQSGDKQLLLSAINSAGTALTAPIINDTVTIGGVVMTITQIKPLSPAGTTVLFDCNLRTI